MVQALALVGVIIMAALVAWYLWSRATRPASPPDELHLPDGLSLQPREMFTKEEAAFYNVLRLAVQEQYLVFAKVPVSRMLLVQTDDPEDHALAAWVLRRISITCADFVLVHPGTLTVAKVIALEGLRPRDRPRSIRDRLAQLAMTAAGLDIVHVDIHQPFTIPGLAGLLGLEVRD